MNNLVYVPINTWTLVFKSIPAVFFMRMDAEFVSFILSQEKITSIWNWIGYTYRGCRCICDWCTRDAIYLWRLWVLQDSCLHCMLHIMYNHHTAVTVHLWLVHNPLHFVCIAQVICRFLFLLASKRYFSGYNILLA